MKYKILRAGSTADLVAQVDMALTDGWALQGGVTYADSPTGSLWAQAIVIYETEDKNE